MNSWGLGFRVRKLLDAERSRPSTEIDADQERALVSRLARHPGAKGLGRVSGLVTAVPNQTAPTRWADPQCRLGQNARIPPALDSRSRGIRRAAAVAAGFLIVYAPLALAGLGAAILIAVGSFVLGSTGSLHGAMSSWPWWPTSRPTEPVRVSSNSAPAEVPPAPTVAPLAPSAPSSQDTQPSVVPVRSVLPARVRSSAHRKHPAHTVQADPARIASRTVVAPEKSASQVLALSSAEALESRLLEQARIAAKGGQSETALRTLSEAAQVPGDPLAEEREALTIIVLGQLGNVNEVRRRIDRFAARFPDSFYLTRLRDLEPGESEPR